MRRYFRSSVFCAVPEIKRSAYCDPICKPHGRFGGGSSRGYKLTGIARQSDGPRGESARRREDHMNLALIGYGKMGREIEQVAKEKNLKVVKTFTSKDNAGGTGLTSKSLAGVDVCIDCSTPAVVFENISAVAKCGK